MCVGKHTIPDFVGSYISFQRYLALKAMKPAERKKMTPRNVFFAGKAAPGCKSSFI